MPRWLKALTVAAAGLLVAAVSVGPPLNVWLAVPGIAFGVVAFVALVAPLVVAWLPRRPGRHRRSHP